MTKRRDLCAFQVRAATLNPSSKRECYLPGTGRLRDVICRVLNPSVSVATESRLIVCRTQVQRAARTHTLNPSGNDGVILGSTMNPSRQSVLPRKAAYASFRQRREQVRAGILPATLNPSWLDPSGKCDLYCRLRLSDMPTRNPSSVPRAAYA